MSHEFDGKRYEKASAHQVEWGTRVITDLGLRGDECVLDIGCGDGTLTSRIADRLPDGKVVGIDASKGMIDTALPKSRDNLQFLLMDVNRLDFVQRFDLVLSNATLHWVKDHTRLLTSVHRALRPGGRLRFNFAGHGNCSTYFAVVRQAMALDEFAVHFARFEWPFYTPSVDEYLALAEDSGLRDVQVWGENVDRYFPDEDAMIRWLDQPSLVPFLARVAERDKDAFRTHVVNRMLERTKHRDGRCFETFRRINMSATR